jgi:hypothetical protein
MVLERWTNPNLSRRACTCEYGPRSCGGKSAGVAKRPRELNSHPGCFPSAPPLLTDAARRRHDGEHGGGAGGGAGGARAHGGAAVALGRDGGEAAAGGAGGGAGGGLRAVRRGAGTQRCARLRRRGAFPLFTLISSNRIYSGVDDRMSSHRRFATATQSLSHDCFPCRVLHVRWKCGRCSLSKSHSVAIPCQTP